MFHHILVPLDGSMRAEQALPIAATLARRTSGSLLLVQVVPPSIDSSGGLAPLPLMSQSLIQEQMQRAKDYLTGVAAQHLLAELNITTEALFGEPAQAVMKAAATHNSDLIVLCSHGRTGFLRWALGSVAHTLLHQSSVPILVLREGETLAHANASQSLRTLVPLDGSPLAEAALAPALALTELLAAPDRGTLHLIQIVKRFQSTVEEGFVSELNEEARRLAQTYLSTVTEHLKATMTDHRLVLTASVKLASDPASALLAAAEQEDPQRYDLIAISTHGRSGLQRWVMGSVTQRLLDTTHVPMLIIRPPQTA